MQNDGKQDKFDRDSVQRCGQLQRRNQHVSDQITCVSNGGAFGMNALSPSLAARE